MKTVYYFILLIAISFFTGCDKDDENNDTIPPVIKLNAPVDGAELLIGDSYGIHFDAEFSDNVMLASYDVKIHPNFDNHQHSKTGSTNTVDFNFARSWSLTDKRNVSIHHHEILIPANATPGKYHLMVYCADVAGNESYIAVNIVLSNDAKEGEAH